MTSPSNPRAMPPLLAAPEPIRPIEQTLNAVELVALSRVVSREGRAFAGKLVSPGRYALDFAVRVQGFLTKAKAPAPRAAEPPRKGEVIIALLARRMGMSREDLTELAETLFAEAASLRETDEEILLATYPEVEAALEKVRRARALAPIVSEGAAVVTATIVRV